MSTPHETILFARTVTDRTDAEVIDFVTTMPDLISKSTVNDRVAHARILHDLARRLREATADLATGCTIDACHYPTTVGLTPGIDVSIDGDVWPGSRYARHIDRCPYHQHDATVTTLLGAGISEADALAAANAGARSVYCPKCERGHEGPCTGPTVTTTPGPGPETMAVIRRVRGFQHHADRNGYGR